VPELHLPKQAVTKVDLPPVCFVTGETEDVEYYSTPFQFVPLWARMSIVLCGLFGILFMFLSMKRVRVDVPMTRKARQEWIRGKRIAGVLVLSALVVLMVSLGMGTDLLLFGVVAFAAILVGAAVYSVVVLKGAGPICKRIDDEVVVLQIPSEGALDAVTRRLGLDGGAVAAAPAPASSGGGSDEDELDRRLGAELDRL